MVRARAAELPVRQILLRQAMRFLTFIAFVAAFTAAVDGRPVLAALIILAITILPRLLRAVRAQ